MRDEILVSATLRVGVALAALCGVVGAIVYFSGHAGVVAAYTTFHAVRVAPALTGFGLLSLGVAILIATPIVRVAILIVVFLRERDWLYTAVSAFVLGVLLLSLNG
jgi:uncharacterized membrane protein